MTEEKKKKKKSYDTRVKFLVRKGLLPDIYRKQIHRSLISKWRREADDKYVGYELNDNNIPEVYELMKKVSEDEKMQRALKTFYKITKTFKDIIGSGREYVNILRKEKTRVVRIVEGAKDNLGIKKAIDGIISYIYLVVDNFSRYIISWRVAHKICAQIRLETFRESIEFAGLTPEQIDITQLIVDGGSENNNEKVETFIDKFPVDKVIALKDILQSNALVEAINKTLKYSYLFPRNLMNQAELITAMKKYIIPDYNNVRPHGSLHGLTPREAYGDAAVDFKGIRLKMQQAHSSRINYNQTHSCLNCFHGCNK